MDIWEQDKLLLFLAFVMPGFVSLKTYELFFPTQYSGSLHRIVEAITYSCINYAILFWLIVYVETSNISDSWSFLYYLFYVFVFIIAPIMWVLIWKQIKGSRFFHSMSPHSIEKPWDFVFDFREPLLVILVLKDGSKLAGKFDFNSFASNTPSEEQLYLEEAWSLNKDNSFDRPKNFSKGIMVSSNVISYIEFFSEPAQE